MNPYLATYLALNLIGLGISFANHGKPRNNENAWITCAAFVLGQSLLYKGGAFAGVWS